MRQKLAKTGLSLDSVPASGKRVWLTDTANLSTGGMAIDRTDEIHPDKIAIASRAAAVLGLDVAGIDMVTPDIARSWREAGGGVVEVNASPGFRMHVQPSEGKARDVGGPVVSMLFPNGAPTAVPLIAVTGTNGKSTTVRMLAHILRQRCKSVGFTSTSGIFVNDECLWEGDASGPKSAKLLLRHPGIDYAVLETARGGILREGLGFRCCDVGAVLNISADHLGLKGIDTLDDLAAVKSVVTESVGRDGVSVLNADNPYTREMARHAGGRVCFFSARPRDPFIEAHLEDGGMAVLRERRADRDEIVICSEGRRFSVIGVKEIPATLGGIACFNIENALAASAMAFALGIEPTAIRAALSGFSSSFEQNPGRLNIYDGHGFRVIIDYAHNPAALGALIEAIRAMRPNYRRVIGCVSTPGDRGDEHIREMGRIAGPDFDLLVFRDLPDTRGRPVGQVTQLLAEAALEAGCAAESIVRISDEHEANEFCLKSAEPGDLVVLMPSSVQESWNRVLAFKPVPAERRRNGYASKSGLLAHV
jgi:cyanophycin synthetase